MNTIQPKILTTCLPVIENALRRYSNEYYAAGWMMNIEEEILRALNNNNTITLSSFKDYELSAMRNVIHIGYWVGYDDYIKIHFCSITNKNDWDNRVNPAD